MGGDESLLPDEIQARVEKAIAEAVELRVQLSAWERSLETRERSEELRAQAIELREMRTHYRNLLDELRDLVENLQKAMASRAGIEQAKGVIMAIRGCTPDDAFDALRVVSQRTNRKLVEVAAEVVDRAQRERVAAGTAQDSDVLGG